METITERVADQNAMEIQPSPRLKNETGQRRGTSPARWRLA
jgi:hypothetical protein